jgi:hypothetical protein
MTDTDAPRPVDPAPTVYRSGRDDGGTADPPSGLRGMLGER